MAKAVSGAQKIAAIKMRKAHRILVITMFSLLFLSMLAAMIYVVALSVLEIGTALMLLIIPAFLFLPMPLYYATWQVTLDATGIQQRLFGIRLKKRLWTQVKEVHSEWLISQRCNGIRIIFNDKKTVCFRMDCDHAEQAKRILLSHCSITKSKTPFL